MKLGLDSRGRRWTEMKLGLDNRGRRWTEMKLGLDSRASARQSLGPAAHDMTGSMGLRPDARYARPRRAAESVRRLYAFDFS
jgi:hypothetical protein